MDLPILATATAYAIKAHGTQTRKGTEIPYVSHLMAVASLVLEHGGTSEQAQAAMLHDVVEDCRAQHEASIRGQFGHNVADMVMSLSDAAPEEGARKPAWESRKKAYLDHLRELAASKNPATLVSACDKLHNARSIIADATDPDDTPGLAVFERFSATREQTAWYYETIAEILGSAESIPKRLRVEAESVCLEVAALARR